jgi:hypothetical protein
MTQIRKGDLVRTVGEDWTDRYLDKIFLVVDENHDPKDTMILPSERILILLDHHAGGTFRAYLDEVVKV